MACNLLIDIEALLSYTNQSWLLSGYDHQRICICFSVHSKVARCLFDQWTIYKLDSFVVIPDVDLDFNADNGLTM